MSRKKPTPENFEQSLIQLETIVKKLETGNLTLEESMSEFEQGVNLTKTCDLMLKEAQLKVQQLTKDGSISLHSEDKDENS
ncbi:MAG: exodeoxyribonuclease VII small subunit [Gammaproteobacteria bacterium]|nr:exodeoxyribonuclease VII small subunit [Gammaproteobacteria bacterium]